MKSPYLAGHSRGVANLATAAARVAGYPADDVAVLRRAGLIHDLGLGVSNAIWDKPGPVTEAESERIRLHPYLTDRMLSRLSALGRSREIAARHHERLDGSGYPRGLTAATLTPPDRLLAAADVYHAMTEPRPHRDPLAPGPASRELRAEVAPGVWTAKQWKPCWRPQATACQPGGPGRAGSPHARWRCSGCWPVATRTGKSPGGW